MDVVVTIVGMLMIAILLLILARVALLNSVLLNWQRAFQLYLLCIWWHYHFKTFQTAVLKFVDLNAATVSLDMVAKQTAFQKAKLYQSNQIASAVLPVVKNWDATMWLTQYHHRQELVSSLGPTLAQKLVDNADQSNKK